MSFFKAPSKRSVISAIPRSSTIPKQHFPQLGRVEETKPGLATRSRPRGNFHHIGTAIGRTR
jgi:hypothetical protein